MGNYQSRTTALILRAVINPLQVQFGLAHDCIRACVYTDYISNVQIKKDAWLSIRDMCYADAIISWNAIFGANSQESHWKKLAAKVSVPERSLLKPFGKEMIVECLKTNDLEWDHYHDAMVDWRNNRVAHFNHSVLASDLPNITWAMHSADLYREWLLALLRAHQASGRQVKITETTGMAMLAMFKAQIAEICK